MPSLPFAVVICHGSYHTPEPYQPFLEALRAHGIEAYCPQLPSSDLTKLNVGDVSHPDFTRDPPSGGYPQPGDDVHVINALLEQLIVEDGKNVMLIGHSSGGFSATASAIPALQSKDRRTQDRPGGVIGIFYICALLVPPGQSVHSFFQPKDVSEAVVPPYCQFPVRFTQPIDRSLSQAHGQWLDQNGLNGLAITNEGAKYFFNGLDDAQAKHWESTLTASPVFKTVLENDAYAALPCAYLIAENDLALPAEYQNGMIALQNERLGINMTVLRCPSGHSPHLTWTKELVAEVQKFEQSIMG